MAVISNAIQRWKRYQSPGETIFRYIDFTAALNAGDSISSVTSIVCAPSDLIANVSVIGPNSAGTAAQVVQFTCTGGTEGSGNTAATYTITCTVHTALGEVLIRSGSLQIAPT